MIDLQRDYFALFELPRRFRIDESALEAAYHQLQGRVHPDRHAHLSDAEKRLSMQWATHVNQGWNTLKKPLARAMYLLELAGRDVALESNTAMSPDFLIEQMEWREAVEEARESGDADALDHLQRRLRQHARDKLETLAVQLDDDQNLDAAAESVRQLMFLDKLRHEIDDALEALES